MDFIPSIRFCLPYLLCQFHFDFFFKGAATTTVTTGATAQIALLKIPFRGINNTPACDYITEKETGEKVGCNLEAGKAYTYSYKLEVLKRYPTVSFQYKVSLKFLITKM